MVTQIPFLFRELIIDRQEDDLFGACEGGGKGRIGGSEKDLTKRSENMQELLFPSFIEADSHIVDHK